MATKTSLENKHLGNGDCFKIYCCVFAFSSTTPESNDLIGWMKKNNRAARAARTLVEFFDVVCQMTTRNFLIYSFNDDVNTQQ